MSHRKPSLLGTLLLVVMMALLIAPGIIAVAHDSLAGRPDRTEQHRQGD